MGQPAYDNGLTEILIGTFLNLKADHSLRYVP